MGWTNWNVDFTLLKYRDEWYRTTDDLHQGYTITQYFDTIVEVTGREFNVIKDRRTGITGPGQFDKMLIMKLFTLGKTFEDLPTFTKHPGPGGVIGFNDNGDLIEFSERTGIK